MKLLSRPLIIFLIFFIFLTEVLSGQFSVKILNENFNSNAMLWDIKSDEYSDMDIRYGKYTIVNKSEGTAITSTIESPHIQYDSFRIKSKLSKIKGLENNGFGLVWGSADANNEFEFVISANGFFKIVKWEQGQKEDLVGWTYQSAIQKWDFSNNELKIESDGVYYRFYINDTYVAVVQYTRPFGNRLGFVINENIEIEIDEIIVENIGKSAFSEKVNANNYDLQISSVDLECSKPGNVLYYNDTALLKIEIANNTNILVKDLMLTFETAQSTNNLIFNPQVMISSVIPNDKSFVIVEIIADENIKSQEINLKISLKNALKNEIDSKTTDIQVIGVSNYSNNYYKPESQNSYNSENDIKQNNNTMQNTAGCAKGCVWSGILSVLLGLILTLL
jgi:hypothetical protein